MLVISTDANVILSYLTTPIKITITIKIKIKITIKIRWTVNWITWITKLIRSIKRVKNTEINRKCIKNKPITKNSINEVEIIPFNLRHN